MNYNIAIVGGGITGLTVAHRLTCLKKQKSLPIKILLIESSERLGGVIKSEQTDNLIIEHGPDAFLAEKLELKNLLSELKLSGMLLPTNKDNRRAFIAQNNKLIPLPVGFFMIAPTQWLPFITSPLFSFLGKLRITLETVIPKKKKEVDESVADFLRRRFGSELLVRAGQPLVGGIYMADINLLSTQSTLPHFAELEQQFGSCIKGLVQTRHNGAGTASGARYNLFSSLSNGMQTLVNRLVERLTSVELHLNTKLITVEKGNEKNWQLKTTGSSFEADVVVFAIPSKLASQTVKELDPVLSNSLAKIESSNSVVVNLLYNKTDIEKPHKGFGFVVPSTENKKIIAAGFISQKFPDRVDSDSEMIRVFIGGQLAPHLFSLNDEELMNLAHDELSSYLGIKGPAIKKWLCRWPNGLPFIS